MIEGLLAVTSTLGLLFGAGPLASDESSEAIFEAVRANDFAAVQLLVADNPALVNARDAAFGATPLHWAAARGHVAVATLLVMRGSDLSATNRDGETPLVVARRLHHDSLIPVLRPVEPALIAAVKSGDFAQVRRILDDDPEAVNQRDDERGGTALHWAAFGGNEGIAALLISKGAMVGALNNAGRTPLAIAEVTGHRGVAGILRASEPQIIQAVRADDLAAVRELLAKRPQAVNDADAKDGATALHWAAWRGNEPIARLLLAGGASRTARNGTGETPLHVAERAGHAPLIEVLLERAE
jgi:ankyrin repeat protein